MSEPESYPAPEPQPTAKRQRRVKAHDPAKSPKRPPTFATFYVITTVKGGEQRLILREFPGRARCMRWIRDVWPELATFYGELSVVKGRPFQLGDHP